MLLPGRYAIVGQDLDKRTVTLREGQRIVLFTVECLQQLLQLGEADLTAQPVKARHKEDEESYG